MHIAYLVSRYPHLSETFIAREMQQLIKMGHTITIARLRWTAPWDQGAGIRVAPARVMRSAFGLRSWVNGLRQATRGNPAEFKQIWQEFLEAQAESTAQNRVKLLTIMLTTLGLAWQLEQSEIEHIRNRFLFGGAISAMWLSRLLDIPYSLTISTHNMPFPRSITRQAVQRAAFCVVPTRETLDLVTALRGSPDGVHFIRTGLDLTEFDILPAREDGATRPMILAVGRLQKKKGFDLLIQACNLLHTWNIDFECQIIGSGPEYAALKQLIVDLGIEDRVLLPGAMAFEQVKAYFQKASMLVMPSRITPGDQDGLPNVITEALAMKVPVVATSVAAIPELIIDGQTGLLVAPEDPVQLARAVQRMLDDDLLRMRLARTGYAKVQDEFDIVKTGKQLETLMLATAHVMQPWPYRQEISYVN